MRISSDLISKFPPENANAKQRLDYLLFTNGDSSFQPSAAEVILNYQRGDLELSDHHPLLGTFMSSAVHPTLCAVDQRVHSGYLLSSAR